MERCLKNVLICAASDYSGVGESQKENFTFFLLTFEKQDYTTSHLALCNLQWLALESCLGITIFKAFFKQLRTFFKSLEGKH